MPRFDNPIELLFAQEAAASLGFSGRRLRKALDALQRYDSDAGGAFPPRRQECAIARSWQRSFDGSLAGFVPDECECRECESVLVQRLIQFTLRLDFFAERSSASPAAAG